MSKFKVGDKVKRTAPYGYDTYYVKNGNIYTVKGYSSNNDTSIELEEDNKFFYEESYFELVESVPNFMVGDIVEAFGVRGEIKEVYEHDIFPIYVEFINGKSSKFNRAGLYLDWHKIPSLKLIERPVKEVTFNCEVFSDGKDDSWATVSSDSLAPFIGKKVEVTVKVKE